MSIFMAMFNTGITAIKRILEHYAKNLLIQLKIAWQKFNTGMPKKRGLLKKKRGLLEKSGDF